MNFPPERTGFGLLLPTSKAGRSESPPNGIILAHPYLGQVLCASVKGRVGAVFRVRGLRPKQYTTDPRQVGGETPATKSTPMPLDSPARVPDGRSRAPTISWSLWAASFRRAFEGRVRGNIMPTSVVQRLVHASAAIDVDGLARNVVGIV